MSQVPFTERRWVLNSTGGWNFSIRKNIRLPSGFLIHISETMIRPTSIRIAEAEYYMQLCGINLFNPDAEYRMMIYISTHPESPRINDARLALGIIFTRIRTTGKQQHIMRSLTGRNWTAEKLPEYFFRLRIFALCQEAIRQGTSDVLRNKGYRYRIYSSGTLLFFTDRL